MSQVLEKSTRAILRDCLKLARVMSERNPVT
jgi:hypothetical protein